MKLEFQIAPLLKIVPQFLLEVVFTGNIGSQSLKTFNLPITQHQLDQMHQIQVSHLIQYQIGVYKM